MALKIKPKAKTKTRKRKAGSSKPKTDETTIVKKETRGRKRKPRGRKPKTDKPIVAKKGPPTATETKVARQIGITVTQLRKSLASGAEKRRKKPIDPEKKVAGKVRGRRSTGTLPPMTSGAASPQARARDIGKQEAALAGRLEQEAAKRTGRGSKLIQRMVAQRPEAAGQPTRLPLVRGSAAQRGNLGEGVNTALPSKMQVDPDPKNYSRAQLRRLIKNGTVKLVQRGRNPDGSPRVIVVSTGRFAPPQAATAEAMGIGKHADYLPSEEELRAMGGFEIRKRGGTVRRKAGGPIGVGAALRGYGKGYKK